MAVVTMVAFMLQKVYFLLQTWQVGTSLTDIIEIVWHGMKLDAAVASYTLFVPCLVSVIGLFTQNRWTEKILKTYYIIIALLIVVITEVDSTLYPFWHFKLDSSVFLYTDKPKEAMASVSACFIIKHVFSAIVLATMLIATYFKVIRIKKARQGGKVLLSALHLVIIAALVIAARGGLGKGTNNVSEAYYCDNQYLNHAAVNPVFNFLYSLGKTEDFGSEAHYFTDKECEHITTPIYDQGKGEPADILIKKNPDILLIIWEGGNWYMLDNQKAGPNTMILSKEGIDFTECYANSFRTDRGQMSLLSGWPAIPKTSLMKIPQKCEHIAALPRHLLDKGYETCFWYGGDISFANTGGYMHQAGFQRTVSDKDFRKKDMATDWGVYDRTLFDKFAEDYMKRGDGKSFDCIMTLSSHEPWQVPLDKFSDERLNAFYYTDKCIGELIARLKKSPKWKNLLVIITADHGVASSEYGSLNDPHITHIPMIWTGGAVKKTCAVDKIMNQTDLPATLLGQLCISHEDFPFSRNVCSKSYDYPSAIHVYNGGISFVDSTGYTTYDIDGERAIFNADAEREKKAKACLQLIYKKTARL